MDKEPITSIAYSNILSKLDQLFSVIPLHGVKSGECMCGNHDCHSPGKHPRITEWRIYQDRRPTDEELAGWRKQFPGCNWGVVTGQVSGIFVLDVDGPAGEASLKGKAIPPTWMVRTGKGRHIYFRWPGFSVGCRTGILPGLDVRGNGGYVVAPGSVHISGRRYEWVDGLSPEDLPEPAEAPAWLLDILRKDQDESTRLSPEDWTEDVQEGERNEHLTRLAGSLLVKMTAEDALPLLLEWNRRRCKPPLPEVEVKSIVKSISNKEAKKPKRSRKKKDQEEEKPTRQTSFHQAGGVLYEQIYTDRSMFLVYDPDSGEITTVDKLETDSEIIAPISGEDVELGAVRLPSGVEEYGDTLSLLAEIEAHIYRYLDVSQNYLKFAAYYILLSWLYDRFHTLPYLRALGDTGCGKSRFLDVIGGLCYKAISASGCVTPAPIYRMLRKWQGTLVLDEADMKNSDEYNEVVTILNCGFERGRPVIRATKDNPDKVQILPVYGPKVFATRRRFKDVALEARCLTEIMRETDRDDIPPVLGRRFFGEQQRLRNKLLLFRLKNYFNVDPEAAATLNLDGIEPRLRQISEAFTSLFANEPKVLESYRQFIQAHQRELIEQRAATKTGQVVETLFALLEERAFHVPTVPSHMGDSELGTGIAASDIAEKTGLNSQAVGAILKGLGLETKRMRQGGQNKRMILYNHARFEKLRKRYILTEQDDERNVPTSLSTNRLGTVGTLEQREVFEI